ncbi:hypothetical protein EDF39_0235 [Frondihabitans sp. PhB161]|nr:hypothetical protein EDF37_0234 [Frondihabitans sp. PhB153]RPF07866.1 hypothetical protein EDF39_0235 [Frondihabitans sp. PhB161]
MTNVTPYQPVPLLAAGGHFQVSLQTVKNWISRLDVRGYVDAEGTILVDLHEIEQALLTDGRRPIKPPEGTEYRTGLRGCLLFGVGSTLATRRTGAGAWGPLRGADPGTLGGTRRPDMIYGYLRPVCSRAGRPRPRPHRDGKGVLRVPRRHAAGAAWRPRRLVRPDHRASQRTSRLGRATGGDGTEPIALGPHPRLGYPRRRAAPPSALK